MRRILSLFIVLSFLSFILSSCGVIRPVSEIDPNQPSAPNGNTDRIEPASDPADSKWDWGYTETTLGESWYLGGKTENSFFTVQPAEEGLLRICFFEAGSAASPESIRDGAVFQISEKHVTNEPGAELEFDLIFTDPFTAFDTLSDEYYVRGDYVALFDDLTSTAFRSTTYPDEYMVLHSDGTAEDVYEGSSYPGSWYVENAHRILYHDDETGSDMRFYYSYSESGSFLGLVNPSGELWEPYKP